MLALIGLVLITYPFWTALYTRNIQSRAKKRWQEIVAVRKSPYRRGQWPKDGDVVARIEIPKIKVDAYVYEGTSLPTLRKGPGHMIGTALPGEKGNCVISGHRTTWGAPFRRAAELKKGDVIYLSDPEIRYTYYVTRVFSVKSTEMWVTRQTPYAELTLTSCTPFYSAAKRIVVKARI